MSTPESTQKPKTFKTLQFRVTHIHWRWKVWKQLYSGDPAASDDVANWQTDMRQFAPAFFAMLHDVLLQDVVLRICKLLDPPKSSAAGGKRTNLSLLAAHENARAGLAAPADEEIAGAARALKKAARPLLTWRNRQLAHDDERTSTGVDRLPPLLLMKIDECLAKATAIVKLLDPHEGTQDFGYSDLIASGDGDSIKQAFRMAAQYREECLRAGIHPLSGKAMPPPSGS